MKFIEKKINQLSFIKKMKKTYQGVFVILTVIAMFSINLLRIKYLKKIVLKRFSLNASKLIKSSITIGDYNITKKGIEFNKISTIKKGYSITLNRLIINIRLISAKRIFIHIDKITFNRLSQTDALKNSTSYTLNIMNYYQAFLNKLSVISKKSALISLLVESIVFEKESLDKPSFNNLRFSNSKLTFTFSNLIKGFEGTYDFSGIINNGSINYRIKGVVSDTKQIYNFSKAIGKISFYKDTIVTRTHLKNNIFLHQKLCSEAIQITQLNLHFTLRISNKKISLEDSYIEINTSYLSLRTSFNIEDFDFISIGLVFNTKIEALLSIIPNLKCKELYSFRTTDCIDFLIKFAFLRSDPLQYNFKLEYDINNCKVDELLLDLSYLKQEFRYRTTDENGTKKIINVQRDCNLNQTDVAKVIKETEDPSFFKHHGIDVYNIGKALALNIANKRFVKGASTITMQLVKNIFLDNDKNITRKFEEMILTLLVENYFKITKERILEIYLQIIPFTPTHHGIEEASLFYFKKESNKIDLLEAIVLSYIVPRPLHFLDAVKSNSKQLDRNLSEHIKNYYPRLGEMLNMPNEKSLPKTIRFRKEIGEITLNHV